MRLGKKFQDSPRVFRQSLSLEDVKTLQFCFEVVQECSFDVIVCATECVCENAGEVNFWQDLL